MSRFYHNTTLKYNIYFNGNEAYKRALNRMKAQNVDNYNEILPIYYDTKDENSSSASGDMDKAITKSSKGIKIHSITSRPAKMKKGNSKKAKEFNKRNEYNRWIDDSYLLMGKAYFIKKEYLDARYNFEYVIRQFPNEKTKFDAYYWLIRNLLEQRSFSAAKEKLDFVEAQKDFPEKMTGKFNAVYADYFIKQKQYDEAIPKLLEAVKYSKRKDGKLRYYFILAQIYEKIGNDDKAIEMYRLSMKRNNDYSMVFNANINTAKCYANKGKNTKDIRKKLNKMLKDDKNIEYKDRIYYAIAEIDKSTGNIDNAITNYKLSSENSVSNDFQKAVSCLNLGEIYYTRLDYKNAQLYYDSTIMYLPVTYDNYSQIRQNSLNLNQLVENTSIVEFEDSVQKLASMSTNDRNKIIDKIIADIVEAERLQREQEALDNQNSMLFDQRRGTNSNVSASTTGKWYFYDQSQISFGRNEFTKKWGNRKNEDNWRRKNKIVMAEFIDEVEDTLNTDSSKNTPQFSNVKSREYYLQNIPLTDSALTASNERIRDALYNIGEIYKDLFVDYPKAIGSYEDLNKRYPQNIYLLNSYYYLYILNKLINNTAEMERYKNLIIDNYPKSNYAMLLQNPNYIQEVKEKEIAENQLYIDTYDSYMSGDCNATLRNINTFFAENDEKHRLAPNFDFFKTLCTGKNADTTAFKTALVSFIQKYSKDELSTVAQNLLQYFGTTDVQALIEELKTRPEANIKNNNLSVKDTNKFANEDASLYSVNPDSEHYYVIYVKSDSVDMKLLSFQVRAYNVFNFSMRTFNVVNYPINTNYDLVTVRSFKNMRQAVNYSKMIASSRDVFDFTS